MCGFGHTHHIMGGYIHWNTHVKSMGVATSVSMGVATLYIHWNTDVKSMGVATSVSMGVATPWSMDSVYLLKLLYENHAFMTTHKVLAVSFKTTVKDVLTEVHLRWVFSDSVMGNAVLV